MRGVFYKLPLDFQQLIEKKDLDKVSLESSIIQYIDLVLTTSFGECKFNGLFGCGIWETDFDQQLESNILRDMIKVDVKEALELHEHRLKLIEVEVTIGSYKTISYNNVVRMKKRISISIQGFIKKTNRPFGFKEAFFVSPFSRR